MPLPSDQVTLPARYVKPGFLLLVKKQDCWLKKSLHGLSINGLSLHLIKRRFRLKAITETFALGEWHCRPPKFQDEFWTLGSKLELLDSVQYHSLMEVQYILMAFVSYFFFRRNCDYFIQSLYKSLFYKVWIFISNRLEIVWNCHIAWVGLFAFL